MAQGVIQTGKTAEQSATYHQFMVMTPESCTKESEKVANLRRMLAAVKTNLARADAAIDDAEFWSKTILVTGFVLDSCIGFLELGKGMLSDVPGMKRVGEVASLGAAAVKTSRDISEYRMGKIDARQLSYKSTANALSAIKTSGTAQKVALNKAKMAVETVGVAIKEKDAGTYTKDRMLENADLVADGAGGKVANYFKGLKAIEGTISAAMSYNADIEKRFDQRLNDKITNDQFRRSQKAMSASLMQQLEARLGVALAALQDCMIDNDPSQTRVPLRPTA
jgi:hypothetical protein